MADRVMRSYNFGPFRLDASGGVLFQDGHPLPLPLKAVELLAVLVASGGRLVTREELMMKVWPDIHVEEANLTVTISLLRKALGDSRQEPRYIETLPKRGYRFVAAVDTEWEAGDGNSQPGAVVARPVNRRWIAATIGLACASLLITSVWSVARAPSPRVVRMVQLTHSGRVDTDPNFVTDGSRLYFTQRQGGHWSLYQVSVEGGEPAALPAPFASTVLYDISPDRAWLLIGESNGYTDSPLWELTVAGGAVSRVGNLVAHDAAWGPGGKWLIYTSGSRIYRANADGSGVRQLAQVDGMLRRPRCDPSGRYVRFAARNLMGDSVSLWEVGADGSGLRKLSPIGEPASGMQEGETDGSWTPDGRMFLFRSVSRSTGGGWRNAVWAMREPRPFGPGAPAIQIYVTPMSLFGPVIGTQRNRLYVIGAQQRYELVEYQPGTESFAPYLSGMSASSLSFARDGKWMAYVSLPGRSLWKSRVDGTARVQLSPATLSVFYPRWSPDGRSIAFMGTSPETAQQAIYVVRDSESAKQVIAGPCDNPSWSADGKSLLYMRGALTPGTSELVTVDLGTGASTVVPDSQGMQAPAWSPDGHYAAAVSENGDELRLFEFATGRWKTLAHRKSVTNIRWSDDSGSVYFQDVFSGAAAPVFRAIVHTGAVEQLTPSHPVTAADVVAFAFSGVTPSGRLFGTLIRNNSDLYAMDVDFGR